MARKKRDEEPEGQGHNATETDRADKACVEKVREIEAKRTKLAGDVKDILAKHKNDFGTPKGSIRKAVKLLNRTPEEHQAKKEVDNRAEDIVQRLFVEPGGQFSFLDPEYEFENQEEEAA